MDLVYPAPTSLTWDENTAITQRSMMWGNPVLTMVPIDGLGAAHCHFTARPFRRVLKRPTQRYSPRSECSCIERIST